MLRFELEFQHQKSSAVIIVLNTCGSSGDVRVISCNLTEEVSGKIILGGISPVSDEHS